MPGSVCVVIPAFNAEKTIERALASCTLVSALDLSIIVVDDASSDRTAGVARAVAATDPRIVVLQQAKNGGVSKARNVGLEASKGDWIAVLDADDEFKPGRLERLVLRGYHENLDVIVDNLEIVDGVSKGLLGTAFPSEWLEQLGRGGDLAFLLKRDLPGLFPYGFGYAQPVLRSAFLRAHGLSYREDIACGEDLLLLQSCVLNGARMAGDQVPGYIYHRYPASLSRRRFAGVALSNANRAMRQQAQALAPQILDDLRARQRWIDRGELRVAMRSRDLGLAILFAVRLGPLFLLQRLWARVFASPRQPPSRTTARDR